jgi:hypothetical protein
MKDFIDFLNCLLSIMITNQRSRCSYQKISSSVHVITYTFQI